MPGEQAGAASAIATTFRQFGQALCVAAVVASHASVAADRRLVVSKPLGVDKPRGMVEAHARGALVVVLGLLATTTRAKASARRTAARVNPAALAA